MPQLPSILVTSERKMEERKEGREGRKPRVPTLRIGGATLAKRTVESIRIPLRNADIAVGQQITNVAGGKSFILHSDVQIICTGTFFFYN